MSTKVYICHLSWYQSRHVLIEDFTSCTDSVSGRVYLSNLLTHYVCSTNSSRSALFWVQLYWTFWTDPFSGNAMINSENKLITTTTTYKPSKDIFHNWHFNLGSFAIRLWNIPGNSFWLCMGDPPSKIYMNKRMND